MIASSALGARRSQTMTSIVGSGPGSPVILAPTVSRTPRIGNGSEPMVSETTALTTMSTTRMITRGATGNRRSRSADRLKEGIAVPSGCEDLDARPERHKSCMGSSDFGSLSVGPSQNHSQWSSRRRHRHRCATVPDSHRVHRDLIGAAPCTRRRLAPVHATRDVPFRQPLAVAARQPRVAGASGTWNAAARGPGGAAGAVPRTPVAIRFDKTPVPRHVAGTTIPNTSATETNGPRPALQTKFTTPHRARQLAGHHRWDVDDPKKPPLQKLWTPPTRGCAPVQGTGTSLVTGGTSHLRGISVRQAAPCHTTWQTPRSPTHLPRRRTGHTSPQTGSPHRAELPNCEKLCSRRRFIPGVQLCG